MNCPSEEDKQKTLIILDNIQKGVHDWDGTLVLDVLGVLGGSADINKIIRGGSNHYTSPRGKQTDKEVVRGNLVCHLITISLLLVAGYVSFYYITDTVWPIMTEQMFKEYQKEVGMQNLCQGPFLEVMKQGIAKILIGSSCGAAVTNYNSRVAALGSSAMTFWTGIVASTTGSGLAYLFLGKIYMYLWWWVYYLDNIKQENARLSEIERQLHRMHHRTGHIELDTSPESPTDTDPDPDRGRSRSASGRGRSVSGRSRSASGKRKGGGKSRKRHRKSRRYRKGKKTRRY
jgi:hypothetical protein